MPPARKVLGFFLRAAVLYAALTTPWRGLQETYAALYRSGAGLVLSSFGTWQVTYSRPQSSSAGRDAVAVHMTRQRQVIDWEDSSWNIGYLPTATLMTLVLATPIPWRRRAWALLLGVFAANGVVFVRIAIHLLYAITAGAPSGASPEPAWQELVKALTFALVLNPSSVFVISIPIWVVLCFRRGDLEQLCDAPRDRTAADRPSDVPCDAPSHSRRRAGPRVS